MDVLRDAGTIEMALCLAQAKFGEKLVVRDTDSFKESFAIVAADAGLNVTFEDPRMNEVLQRRRAEWGAQHAREAHARAARLTKPKKKKPSKSLGYSPGSA